MRHYKLTEGAKADLVGIWNYTFDTWGETQTDKYIRRLEAGFARIAKGTALGKKPLPSYAKLRSVLCEHHYIFFLKGSTPVILAILHEKMDFIFRLRKLLGAG